MNDMDPESAAEFASGAGDEPTADVSLDGDGFDNQSGLFDRLFDGSASGPAVPQVESDYGLSKHWAIFVRGCTRVATGDGVPPVAEMIMGAVLGTLAYSRNQSNSTSDDALTIADE